MVGMALERHARAIAGLPDDAAGAQVLDACRDAADLPQALAAIDLAVWDRAGRREGRPLAALLADDPLAAVPVNATIGAVDRAGAADAAAEAARAGFRCVKVKVGLGDDAGRVAAVRAAAGPEMGLRLDANGAWSVDEAVRAIGAMSAAGLEIVEEPVHGIEALRAVRERVATRIGMDETTAEPGALASGAADAVCLKISRCGGVSGTLAAAALVRTLGGEPYLASTLDGPLGIAAACTARPRCASSCRAGWRRSRCSICRTRSRRSTARSPSPPAPGCCDAAPAGDARRPRGDLGRVVPLHRDRGRGPRRRGRGRRPRGVRRARSLAWAALTGRLGGASRPLREWLVLGAVNAALPFVLIAAAELTIPASLAAIINATAPLFSAVIAVAFLGTSLTARQALGLALGIAGVALVVGLAPVPGTLTTVLAVAASLGAAAAYGAGAHLVKLRFGGVAPMTLAIGQQVAAAAVALPFLAAVPPRHAPGAGPVAAVLVLGVVCTGLAYLLYFRLIEELGAMPALTVTYLVPVFGVLWGALFRDEHVTPGMVAGAAVVLAGVLLVTGTGGRARRPGPRAAGHAPPPG